MKEQVEKIAKDFISKVHRGESDFHSGRISEDIHHRQLDCFVSEIASLMPKPLDVEELLWELEDYIAYGYQSGDKRLNIPVDEFKAIASRFCVPQERVCVWKYVSRKGNPYVIQECQKDAPTQPELHVWCDADKVIERFGPYCRCGGKIKIEVTE